MLKNFITSSAEFNLTSPKPNPSIISLRPPAIPFEFTSFIFGPIYVYLNVYATMIDDESSKFGHYLMFNHYIDKFYIIDEDMRVNGLIR